jgi:multidrug resistance efflux pump
MLQGAELDLKRYQDLVKTNAIPRQQLYQQQALVLQDRGLVMSDQRRSTPRSSTLPIATSWRA